MKTESNNHRPAVRVGSSMLKVLAALNAQSGPMTAASLRAVTDLPRGNVSTALIRLAEEEVLEVSHHATLTYVSKGGVVKPMLQYQLSSAGRDWAKQVFLARSREPRPASIWVPAGGG